MSNNQRLLASTLASRKLSDILSGIFSKEKASKGCLFKILYFLCTENEYHKSSQNSIKLLKYKKTDSNVCFSAAESLNMNRIK